MASAKGITGKDLPFYRKANAADAAGTYMGMVTNGEVTETFEYDDATVPNTDAPGTVPARSSVPKQYGWSCNTAGVFDAQLFQQVRTDFLAGIPLLMSLKILKPANAGGGHFDGAVWFENIKINYDGLGVVKFSAQMRGEGMLTWTAAT